MASFETPPSASLNRVRIVDLPGLPLDDHVRGRRGDELLSNRSLLAYAAQHAAALGLGQDDLASEPPPLTRGDVQLRTQVPEAVDAALASPDRARRAAAEAIASRLGRNLGWLLIALHRGDPVNQAARPDWQPADWQRWRSIDQVWLGGGLTQGRLGEAVAAQARAQLDALGHGHIRVTVSPYRGLVAVVGAARMACATDTNRMEGQPQQPEVLAQGTHSMRLALDFGHTLVKGAHLTYEAGRLTGVEPLERRLVNWAKILPQAPPPEPAPAEAGRSVLAFMVDTITESMARLPALEAPVLVSVAAYLQQGRLVGNGPYASIHATAQEPGADQLVADALSRRLGRPIAVRLVHDGTAASLAHAGTPNQAVIMLGTALGVGFPPTDEAGLCPVTVTTKAPRHQVHLE